MSDFFDLQRFVNAQTPVYNSVCEELRRGQKQGHWMWFIFPQLRGLGSSSMATKFGISGRQEAEAYLRHPVLGPHLEECTGLVNVIEGRSIEEIFGYPDDLKFRSCMTLFRIVAGDNRIFNYALEKYFEGDADPRTLDMA
jgi:uncharacterized protein (DUF1810 family)